MTDDLAIEMDFNAQFSFDLFEEKTATESAHKKTATAHKTKSRIQARRAKSEETLATILPPRIEQGDSWHVISAGDVDSLSFLTHLLKTTNMDYVMFSTWCMAGADVVAISEFIKNGKIKRIDAYVGEIFPNQYADAYEKLKEVARQSGGRVCVFRNHSKLFLCKSGADYWVIESSANINTNPRAENTTITADAGLYGHHLAYFDGVKSFVRDFDDWTPYD